MIDDGLGLDLVTGKHLPELPFQLEFKNPPLVQFQPVCLDFILEPEPFQRSKRAAQIQLQLIFKFLKRQLFLIIVEGRRPVRISNTLAIQFRVQIKRGVPPVALEIQFLKTGSLHARHVQIGVHRNVGQ